jgi:hypothetical protein
MLAAGNQVQFASDLTVIVCGECGGTYAIAERYRRQKQEQGGYWNCPYCKCSWGYGSSEINRLRKEVETANNSRDFYARRLDAVVRSRRAVRAHLTRSKKKLERVAHGVCPCCNRSFQNLRRHMSAKHPGFTSDEAKR